jgi:carbon-monoxide dehydrogenase medium subunit
MIPAQFDYVRPASLHDALATLRDREGEAKILAGGYSLLPLLKLRLAEPALLVDLRDVGGLDGIVETDDELIIGGRATHRQIADNEAIAQRYPMLHEAAAGIGDPQIRNWGTIGGSCAHADPSSDWPAVLLAARAAVVCRSADQERSIAARDFFRDTFTTAIDPDEILMEVRFPTTGRGSGAAYRKLERRSGDFATVGVAASLVLGPDGRMRDVGIGLTAVAETPFAPTPAEALLDGELPSEELILRAARAAADESRPASDAHGPAEYKRAMVAEMASRAIRAAVERATRRA